MWLLPQNKNFANDFHNSSKKRHLIHILLTIFLSSLDFYFCQFSGVYPQKKGIFWCCIIKTQLNNESGVGSASNQHFDFGFFTYFVVNKKEYLLLFAT